jgi:hypothetical protein
MSAIDDVKKAAADLVGHFGASRVGEYFQCFSESADFIFYTHTERLKTRKAYEDLWKSWEAEMDFKILSCTSSDQDIRMVGNNVAVMYDVIGLKDGRHPAHITVYFGPESQASKY